MKHFLSDERGVFGGSVRGAVRIYVTTHVEVVEPKITKHFQSKKVP